MLDDGGQVVPTDRRNRVGTEIMSFPAPVLCRFMGSARPGRSPITQLCLTASETDARGGTVED